MSVCRKFSETVRDDGAIVLQLQDAYTSTFVLTVVYPNTSSSARVSKNATLPASAKQNVFSPGRDVAIQVDIPEQEDEVKSTKTKSTTQKKDSAMKGKRRGQKGEDNVEDEKEEMEAEGEQVKVKADGRRGRKRQSCEYETDTSV